MMPIFSGGPEDWARAGAAAPKAASKPSAALAASMTTDRRESTACFVGMLSSCFLGHEAARACKEPNRGEQTDHSLGDVEADPLGRRALHPAAREPIDRVHERNQADRGIDAVSR